MRPDLKILTLLTAMLALGFASGCQSSQRAFTSPDDAIVALDDAVQKQDKAELHKIFGPEADELKTGDPEQDHDDAVVFARKLKAAHKVRLDTPDHATVLIGEDEWPFAVPLVRKDGAWRFDTAEGLEELTNRRIGRNELMTIEACRTLIDAQAEFFARDPDGLGMKHYAQKLMSSEEKKDGLYWPAPGGVDPSPIGPAMALAATRRDEKGERIPFNGYLYKLLYRQVESAPGGAMDYRQDGVLTRGWAVIAYPAQYQETGVMSFACSSNGDVYQRDLGADTEKAVAGTDAFDPGSGWTKLEGSGAKQP